MSTLKQEKIKIGILMGGSSREREISFAGGRTVYDNLNKDLFQAIPIFIDSLGNFILLDWQYLYKGTIRDFYPPADLSASYADGYQLYIESLSHIPFPKIDEIVNTVGVKINLSDLHNLIDFAFLTLHGSDGEDGRIQGLLETLRIPYSGSGIRASSIGIDKSFQKKLMEIGGFAVPKMQLIKRQDWLKASEKTAFIQAAEAHFETYPIVVRPSNQGSSIGVSISKDAKALEEAIDKAFFIEHLQASYWNALSEQGKAQYLFNFTDIRTGLGFPVMAANQTIQTPSELGKFLDEYLQNHSTITFEALNSEQIVVLESFIKGKEFSCVVVQDIDGTPIALPPTEIIKGDYVFDYRSKYLAGLARKVTPINLPSEAIESIRKECVKLFHFLDFNVYARIDGFIQADGTIFLNDPNTTSGMLPSSFFFHQAAEIGLNPSQFLTYIIYASIQQRIATDTQLHKYDALFERLETSLENLKANPVQKKRVAVFLGGYSSERHISVESGRNIYEKLSSSVDYTAIPIFVSKDEEKGHVLHTLPINLLLKDNADDIKEKIYHFSKHPIINTIQQEAKGITRHFANEAQLFAPKAVSYEELKEMVDMVFIALHGRPGEDGDVQARLEKLHIPFNGSSSHSAHITINKYETLQRLREAGFPTANQYVVQKSSFTSDKQGTMHRIESLFSYPFIAKPIDDGCSSAVKVIHSHSQLDAFLTLMFRNEDFMNEEAALTLKLKLNEEFPHKDKVLIETLIAKEDAAHFLEITGGLLTHFDEKGNIAYEVFEPSETLSSGEVLSLEEKFLAGEGQNITPARFVSNKVNLSHAEISKKVREDLQKAAEILGVTGYARIDAFVKIHYSGKIETFVIEVNSLPGMTPATCIFHQCAINGYKPADFIDKILQFGVQRNLKLN